MDLNIKSYTKVEHMLKYGDGSSLECTLPKSDGLSKSKWTVISDESGWS